MLLMVMKECFELAGRRQVFLYVRDGTSIAPSTILTHDILFQRALSLPLVSFSTREETGLWSTSAAKADVRLCLVIRIRATLWPRSAFRKVLRPFTKASCQEMDVAVLRRSFKDASTLQQQMAELGIVWTPSTQERSAVKIPS